LWVNYRFWGLKDGDPPDSGSQVQPALAGLSQYHSLHIQVSKNTIREYLKYDIKTKKAIENKPHMNPMKDYLSCKAL